MNKKSYIIICLCCLSVFGISLYFNVKFKDNSTCIIPVKSKKKPVAPRKKRIRKRPRKVNLAQLSKKNLFDPLRGVKPKTKEKKVAKKAPTKNPKFKLTGIFKVGESAGAIISIVTRYSKDAKKQDKKYFYLGKEVCDGFILSQIDSNMVSLRRGDDVLELPLEKPQVTRSRKPARQRRTTPKRKYPRPRPRRRRAMTRR